MATDPQWDQTWFDRFKKVYATNITTLSIYPGDPLAWLRIADVPYGQKQINRPFRKPNQRVHVSKNEEYPDVKYAESLVIERDMPNLSDAINVKEEYYAGDTANALGHVADLALNFKDGLVNFSLNGSDVDPVCKGILEDTTSGSTTKNDPGHVDTASAASATGVWDIYDEVAGSLATMEYELEAKGFFGKKIMGCPPLIKPFMQNYVVDYTAISYPTVMGYQWFFNEAFDSGATTAAAAVYMIDADSFELHMTPLHARAYWSDEQECYCWRWKTRAVPISMAVIIKIKELLCSTGGLSKLYGNLINTTSPLSSVAFLSIYALVIAKPITCAKKKSKTRTNVTFNVCFIF